MFMVIMIMTMYIYLHVFTCNMYLFTCSSVTAIVRHTNALANDYCGFHTRVLAVSQRTWNLAFMMFGCMYFYILI